MEQLEGDEMTASLLDDELFQGVIVCAIILVAVSIIWVWGGNTMNSSMASQIIRGDLPDCANTTGSPTGYYCRVEKKPFYCKIDPDRFDVHLKNVPMCESVMMV